MWSERQHLIVDDIIPNRQDLASHIQWLDFDCTSSVLWHWHSVRIGLGCAVIHLTHD